MKTLHLTLKKKWFDMILLGEKKEEYREIKAYWIKRLNYAYTDFNGKHYSFPLRTYDFINFKNGYAKNAPSFIIECKGITTGNAKPEWSDNWEGEVFIIKLGNIVSSSNTGAVASN